jgi:hypothetical protein
MSSEFLTENRKISKMIRKSMQFRLLMGVFALCLSASSLFCIASVPDSAALQFHSAVRGSGHNSPQLQESIRSSQKQAGNTNPKRNRLSLDERQILRKQIREAENEIYYFNK